MIKTQQQKSDEFAIASHVACLALRTGNAALSGSWFDDLSDACKGRNNELSWHFGAIAKAKHARCEARLKAVVYNLRDYLCANSRAQMKYYGE